MARQPKKRERAKDDQTSKRSSRDDQGRHNAPRAPEHRGKKDDEGTTTKDSGEDR